MKIKELRQQTDTQLQKLVKESKEKLRSLRFSLSNRQLKNFSDIGKSKKNIARALTILEERRAAENQPEKK